LAATKSSKRESAAQRDERVVREAGPWTVVDSDDDSPMLQPYELAQHETTAFDGDEYNAVELRAEVAMMALVRLANRLSRRAKVTP